MEQQIDSRPTQKPGSAPAVAGIVSTAGLAGVIIQSRIPAELKFAYLALLLLAGFTAYVVRYFLRLHERQVSKQTETLEQILMENRLHQQENRTHDMLSAEAHKDAANTMRAVARALDRLCSNGTKPHNQGGDTGE